MPPYLKVICVCGARPKSRFIYRSGSSCLFISQLLTSTQMRGIQSAYLVILVMHILSKCYAKTNQVKLVALGSDDTHIETKWSQLLELRGKGHQADSMPRLSSLKLDSWPSSWVPGFPLQSITGPF